MPRDPNGYGPDMAADSREWTVPAPLRALMWWPGLSFVLALVAPPEATVGAIAVAGLVLVGLGALAGSLGRRARRVAEDASPRAELEPAA